MVNLFQQNSDYQPNPKADDFDKEKVIDSLDTKSVFKKSEGLTLGGSNAQSVEDMRAKRLARLAAMSGSS